MASQNNFHILPRRASRYLAATMQSSTIPLITIGDDILDWTIDDTDINEMNMAIDDSINSTAQMTFKPTVERLMKDIKNRGTINELKVEFANSKREGFGPDSVIFDFSRKLSNSAETDTELPVFNPQLNDYLCPDCLSLPFIPKFCRLCHHYYCERCLDLERSNNNGCPQNPILIGDHARGYGDHKISDDIERSARRFLNDFVSIRCEYGELSKDENKEIIKWMDWSTAQRHYSEGICPKAKCKDCGLYRHNMSIKHSNSKDCIQELDEFALFLEAKHSIKLTKETEVLQTLKRKLKSSEDTLKSIKESSEKLKKENEILKERQLHRANDSFKAIERLEKVLKKYTEKDVNREKGKDEQLTLYANPTDAQSSTKNPIIFMNHYMLGKKSIEGIDRQNTFEELLYKGLELWQIPLEERHNYTLFDIRCRVRDENIVMGTQLRNVHTFNLIPTELVSKNTAYEILVDNLSPKYKPNEVSNNSGEDVAEVDVAGYSGKVPSMIVVSSARHGNNNSPNVPDYRPRRHDNRRMDRHQEHEFENRRANSNKATGTTRYDRHGNSYKTKY